jgi:hypothetical protein
MTNPLKIHSPPPRRSAMPTEVPPQAPERAPVASIVTVSPPVPGPKFRQVKEDERVQFNKRVTRRVADGFEMLAIRSRRKVPDLMAEALDLLEERYGKVG